jgi:hypothetical protein
MSRRDVSGVSRADLALRPILHHNLHPGPIARREDATPGENIISEKIISSFD